MFDMEQKCQKNIILILALLLKQSYVALGSTLICVHEGEIDPHKNHRFPVW